MSGLIRAMNWPVVMIGSDRTVAEALRVADDRDLHHLVVTGEADAITGVLCTCDLQGKPPDDRGRSYERPVATRPSGCVSSRSCPPASLTP